MGVKYICLTIKKNRLLGFRAGIWGFGEGDYYKECNSTIISYKNTSMRIIFYLFISLVSTLSFGQANPIAVVSSNGATTTLRYTLAEAIEVANNNDIIYIPGGSFAGEVTIAKKLTLIGVGHYPDTNQVTGITNIVGNIYFNSGADGSTVDGIHFLSGYGVIINEGNLQNINVYRSSLDWVRVTQAATLNGGNFRQNVIRNTIYVDYNDDRLFNITVSNCIFSGGLHFGKGAIISNCIFLETGETSDNGVGINNYIGCIFMRGGGLTQNGLSTFSNCAFSFDGAGYDVSPFFINCHFNQTSQILFNKEITSVFSYERDYYKVVNGLNVGIFSGSSPYIHGALPPAPHINTMIIDGQTGANGALRVRFNVTQ